MQLGRPDDTLVVLEEASRWKTAAYPHLRTTWYQVQIRLRGIYRLLGREAGAQEVEAELRRLLARADPDSSVLCELDNLRDRCNASARPA